jgi:hypothetical protein
VWAIWLLILLLELATPPAVVLGILDVVPLLLGASQRTPTQAWRFLLICCTSTLLNLLVPLPLDHNIASVLIDHLLVCLGLVVTTALVVRNQKLERQRIAIEVALGQANLRGDVIATLAHDIKTPGWEPWPPAPFWRAVLRWRPSATASNAAAAWIDGRDGGEGFPPEQLPRLFQRFAQSGNDSAGAGSGAQASTCWASTRWATTSATTTMEGEANPWASSSSPMRPGQLCQQGNQFSTCRGRTLGWRRRHPSATMGAPHFKRARLLNLRLVG